MINQYVIDGMIRDAEAGKHVVVLAADIREVMETFELIVRDPRIEDRIPNSIAAEKAIQINDGMIEVRDISRRRLLHLEPCDVLVCNADVADGLLKRPDMIPVLANAKHIRI